MFFKIIDKYIFRELLKIFLISIFAMTMVLYLDKFLFMAEMIVNRNVSFLEMTMMMVYISPSFFAITIPMAKILIRNTFNNSLKIYLSIILKNIKRGCLWMMWKWPDILIKKRMVSFYKHSNYTISQLLDHTLPF